MEELIKKWNEFCNYVMECVPNWTDNDFTFSNFMDWLQNPDIEQPHDY